MTDRTDTDRLYRRREMLAVAGGSLAAGLAGCLGSGAEGTASPTATDPDSPTPTATPSPTPSPTPQLQAELAALRDATAKYSDPKAALKDGFKVMGPYVPGMGWHFINPDRVKAAAKNGFDITKPQLVTYVKTDDGGLKLGAAEFGVPKGAVDGTPDLFSDEGTDATEKWHEHKTATHVFAYPDNKRTNPKDVDFMEWLNNNNWAEFRPPDKELSAGDTANLNWGSLKAKEGGRTERVVDLVTTHPTLTTLHAWVHAKNPDGVFHPANSKYGGHDH